ncbi:sulfite exporter TauE/SafE family protein [Streptomyces rubellomurinus]|uniref:Probable membrane transporter protein n=1 Tax=Streptomyces rubellomurinus (strain ATCC 31215) TaxID=359131 RepID=A0A0F2TAM8_STRR3|nr:sulfite exporter TauE/SafE family protein [Streptomyces rubellomurinus]KJS59486.1 integral membrane family protein [Streptomyces rubellomurinus]
MTALLLALAAGAVVGLALGGLGGGGSMLAVPALVYLLGFSPALATTASLLIVAATSLTALLAHARAGRVRWRTGALFAAAGLPAAAATGALSVHLPGALLTGAFAVLAALAAWRMLRPPSAQPPERSAAGTGPAAAAGTGLGAVTGLLGVGGGFLAVPALVSVLAFTMAEAVGTSLLVITANSLAALLPRLGSAGAVDWAVAAPFAGAAVLGAWDGKRLADRLSGRTLQRAFALALLAVAALMLVTALV